MKSAASFAGGDPYESVTYFGDGPWDEVASAMLGYSFILIGDRLEYRPSIADFTQPKSILSLMGLSVSVPNW